MQAPSSGVSFVVVLGLAPEAQLDLFMSASNYVGEAEAVVVVVQTNSRRPALIEPLFTRRAETVGVGADAQRRISPP
jgi:hypothetical protein